VVFSSSTEALRYLCSKQVFYVVKNAEVILFLSCGTMFLKSRFQGRFCLWVGMPNICCFFRYVVIPDKITQLLLEWLWNFRTFLEHTSTAVTGRTFNLLMTLIIFHGYVRQINKFRARALRHNEAPVAKQILHLGHSKYVFWR